MQSNLFTWTVADPCTRYFKFNHPYKKTRFLGRAQHSLDLTADHFDSLPVLCVWDLERLTVSVQLGI